MAENGRLASLVAAIKGWLDRPVGRWSLMAIVLLLVATPWLLFFDPIAFFRVGHIPRDPLAMYRLHSDDFAYVGASRTLERTVSNLFVPHNTHIVPTWRIVTWMLIAWAGSLEKLPEVFAEAAYGILVAVILLTGRFVAKETGRPALGLGAMALVGTTSVMASAVCWYSAGQTLWAGFGILATLWYAQRWRQARAVLALPLMAVSALIAGGFWTIGHMAGPAAAVYLWQDGRRHCRFASAVPLLTGVLAVALFFALGANRIDSKVSFHGRTTGEAAEPLNGLLHTARAIPENLILGNLGLKVHTTAAQGVVISLSILGAWAFVRLRSGGGLRAFRPLECAGLSLVLGSYLVEWTVRGYMPFQYLRTINLGMIVPWYDVIPQIGAVLFICGWIAGSCGVDRRVTPGSQPTTSRRAALAVLGLVAVMLTLNSPRVDMLWRNWVSPPSRIEEERFPLLSLLSMRSMRATVLIMDHAEWQRKHLHRLDQAQKTANQLGIGKDAVARTFGRLDAPELPDVYDAIDLLALPKTGAAVAPEVIRRALGPYLFKEPEPRPSWLTPTDPWPPTETNHWTESDVDGP